MLAADAIEDEVRSLQRRILLLPTPARLRLIRSLEAAEVGVAPAAGEATEQHDALAMLATVVSELELGDGGVPTARQFAASASVRAAGWTVARVRKAFGSWAAACGAYIDRGGVRSAGPRHRAATRAANRHQARSRDSYLHALRLWLATDPPSTTAADYTAWRTHYNASRPAGTPTVVSAVTLRNRLQRRWPDLVRIGRDTASVADTPQRPEAHQARLHGPHDLIGTAELREITGLAATALRSLTYDPRFPKPAYIRRHSPRTRLWRRADVLAFLRGESADSSGQSLQDAYLDARETAQALGLSPNTVHRGISGPRIPPPDVHVAGIKLWHRTTVRQ